MDSILQGLQHVIYYLDNSLVTGTMDEEYKQNLYMVLRQLKEHGMRLKKEKYHIWQSSVDYLGHHIGAQGIHVVAPAKVDAILKASALHSVSELGSFLGMINDYGKFIANMSTLVHPLKTLLKTGQTWKWDQECENVFRAAKQQLNSSSVLAQYDSKLPIRLAEDIYCYRIGAVLSRILPNVIEHPVRYAS